MSQIQALRRRIEEALEPLGFALVEISAKATPEGDDVVSIRVKVEPKALKSNDEHELDLKFDDIVKELKGGE